jgi:pimeloyl-ACP methyl ester carboxylesterase
MTLADTAVLANMVHRTHRFQVPLDHARPSGPTIEIFAREVVARERAADDLPWLVWFQGGPGGHASRPTAVSGWLAAALRQYRVLFLDQRGTGASTPITFQTLTGFASARDQADYIGLFRQDSIVADAEYVRRELLGPDGRWSVIGQSYGGFCVVHYLSVAGDSLNAAYITGGLPSLTEGADAVYRATYRRVQARNDRYFARYPRDREIFEQIVAHLLRHDIRLPSGDRLTPQRVQHLGLNFGTTPGFEVVHYLLELAFVRPNGSGEPQLSEAFLDGIEGMGHFASKPLYAMLQEIIYNQQQRSGWSAERLLAEFPQFRIEPGQPSMFTGEMFYPWMFDEVRGLAQLRECAHLLAERDDWPPLYNLAALGRNTVPAAAVVYYDDMFVDHDLSMRSAAHISNLATWVTNEYEHDGLFIDGERIFSRLLDLAPARV